MVKRCVVANCSNHYGSYEAISLHLFPKDRYLRKKWSSFVGLTRADWKASDYSTVCSAHFKSDCYVDRGYNTQFGITWKKILRPGSVPSIYPRTSDFQTSTPRSAFKKPEHSCLSRLSRKNVISQHNIVEKKVHLPPCIKRLSDIHDTRGNSELAQTKEKILDMLLKSGLEKSSLIEFFHWMRTLLLVQGGSCDRTKGMYYVAEVEDNSPTARAALQEVVISDSRVQWGETNSNLTDYSTTNNDKKMNVKLHLEYQKNTEFQQVASNLPIENKHLCIQSVKDPVNQSEVELGTGEDPSKIYSAEVQKRDPIPVVLVHVDRSQGSRFFFLNNDNTDGKLGHLQKMNIDQTTCLKENEQRQHNDEMKMDNFHPLSTIKQEPIETDSLKDTEHQMTEAPRLMDLQRTCIETPVSNIELQIRNEPGETKPVFKFDEELEPNAV